MLYIGCLNFVNFKIINMKKESILLILVFFAFQSYTQVLGEDEFKFQVNEAEKRLKDKSTRSAAHRALGHFYYYGYSLPFTNRVIADYDKAFKHFKKAQKDHHQAVFNMGYFYYYGYAVKKDKNKAIKYFENAANENNPLAMLMLALINDEGDGVPKNEKLAENWAIQAVEIMHQKSTKADLKNPKLYLKKWGLVNEFLIDAFIYSYPQ